MIAKVWLTDARDPIIYGDDPALPAVARVQWAQSDRRCVITFAVAGSVEYSGVAHVITEERPLTGLELDGRDATALELALRAYVAQLAIWASEAPDTGRMPAARAYAHAQTLRERLTQALIDMRAPAPAEELGR